MDIEVDLVVACSVPTLVPYISDLERYPLWMGLVHAVQLDQSGTGWQVELRGKIGPFSRSKRLRMVSVPDLEPLHFRFIRQEIDGRDHGLWVLEARLIEIDPHGPKPTSHLSMTLHYQGGLLTGIVERVLQDEIEASKNRLRDLVS